MEAKQRSTSTKIRFCFDFLFFSILVQSINVDSMVQRWRRGRACCWKDWEVLKPSTSLQRTLVHCARHLRLSTGNKLTACHCVMINMFCVFWFVDVRVCKINQKRTHT